MKVPYESKNSEATEADLYVIGNCLAIEVDGITQRVGPLSATQWRLLAQSARERGAVKAEPQLRSTGGKQLRSLR